MQQMMADHDDIYVSRKFLKKQLYLRYGDTGIITTHKHAELWIDEAIRVEKVAPFKKDGSKKILVCLTSMLQLANDDDVTNAQIKTSKEEKFVEDLLRLASTAHNSFHKNDTVDGDDTDEKVTLGWVSRKDINDRLRATFPRMESPLMRAKVFQNGSLSKKFGIARGPFGQTVGINEQDAQDSLERMTKARRVELEWDSVRGSMNSKGGNMSVRNTKSSGESCPELPPFPQKSSAAVGAESPSGQSVASEESRNGEKGTLDQQKNAANPGGGDSISPRKNADNSDDDDDETRSNSEGVLSEWDDAASMDSAEIDAMLFHRSSTA